MQLTPVQVSSEHNSVVTPGDPRIPNLFPHQKTLPDGRHVLPHKPEEVRVLRNLGYAVPSPILSGYDWGGNKPFHAQVVTAGMLVVEPRAFVLSGLGSGKTASVLFAYDYLKKQGLARKMLVVAPLSTLSFTWVQETFKWFPQYSVGVVHGTKAKRRKVLKEDHDIYVINHDGLGTVHNAIRSAFFTCDIMCIDEVAVFRNHTSKRHKVAASLTGVFGRVWGLTGTPTPRSPMDAYGIIKLVNPGAGIGPTRFTHFREELMVKRGQFLWVPRPGAHQKVYDYMQPAVRFTLAECVDMPPVVHQSYEAALGAEQKRVYDALFKHSRTLVENGSVTAVNAAVVLNKLNQVACGSVFKDDGSVHFFDISPRMQVIRELIEENDRSVIVFCAYVAAAKRMVEDLSKDYKTHLIHGGVPQKERARIFGEIQASSDKHVLVAHPAAMSHGINLQAASLVIWAGAIWSLEVFEQATARIIRPGQTASRILVATVSSTRVENRIYNRLRRKEKMQNSLLELFED